MSKHADQLSIGMLAKTADVNIETIRFYERKGLLVRPTRGHREIRRYTAKDVSRVKFIKTAKGLGFTLSEIGVLLTLEDGTHCGEARVMAEQKLSDVREKLLKLERIKSALELLVADCDMTNMFCPLIASLQTTD
ncbi:MAG: MerR family transcriptional regulator [Vicinamibacterales bacterium]